MEMRHLQTLIAVANADSFAHAADQLFLTPAAVSQQVRQLEEELGLELFDRSLRPPQLNGYGEALLGRARELVEQFNDFKATAGEQQIRGLVSIGSINGITVSLLPETLRSLRRRHPEVRVRIVEGSSRTLIRRLKRRELDAAIVSDIYEIPESMERFPIFSEALVVIARQQQPVASWKKLLHRQPFLRLNRNSGLGALIEKSLRKYRVRVEEVMELDSTDSIVQMTLAGLGHGIVPMGRISEEASRSLVIMPFGEPQIHRQVVLVRRRNAAASELSQLLYQELQAQIAKRT